MSLSGIDSQLQTIKSASRSEKASDRQRMLWEQEFWRQQRDIQQEQTQDQRKNVIVQEGASVKNELKVSIPTSERILNKDNLSVSQHAEQIAGLASPSGTMAASIVNTEQNTIITSPGYLNPVTAYSKDAQVKVDARSSLPQNNTVLPQGLIQENNGELSIWSSNASLKNDRQLLHRLKKAIHFFGFNLRRLTVSGQEIELSGKSLPDTKNYLKEI